MNLFRVHARLTLVGVVTAALLVVLGFALVRSRTAGCDLAPPSVTLPSQLRVIGGFDRPFDAGDQRALRETASQAGSVIHPDLTGTAAGGPVLVSAATPDKHDAIVVPLRTPERRVAGLVAFLRDCSGRAYYSDTEDLLASGATLAGFPAVDLQTASARLGIEQPRLVYLATPFQPRWRDPAGGRTIPAL